MPDYSVPNEFERKLGTIAGSDQNPAKTKSDVITRAVALYDYLHRNVVEPGHRVAIIDKDGKIVQIIDPLP